MTPYQKIAILIIRLVGFMLFLFGFMGLLHTGISSFGNFVPGSVAVRFPSVVVWTISGLVLSYFANGIGRFLGRGLD